VRQTPSCSSSASCPADCTCSLLLPLLLLAVLPCTWLVEAVLLLYSWRRTLPVLLLAACPLLLLLLLLVAAAALAVQGLLLASAVLLLLAGICSGVVGAQLSCGIHASTASIIACGTPSGHAALSVLLRISVIFLCTRFPRSFTGAWQCLGQASSGSMGLPSDPTASVKKMVRF
jgi:hypothetical protein